MPITSDYNRVTFVIPSELLKRLDEQASKRIVSRSVLIRVACEKLLGRLESSTDFVMEEATPICGDTGSSWQRLA